MKRKFLVAAVALAPLLWALARPAAAQVSITTSTSTPIATATASNGAPANVDVAAGGSIGVTAPGYAVEINSSNSVTVEGALGFTGIDSATGVIIQGGNTGQFTSTGTITVTETYTASADPNNDGLDNGAWAQGMDRIGIQVTGTSPFVGGITPTGTITVQGNDSEGILIQAPITGDLTMQTVVAATSTTAATTAIGSISITGDNTVGVQVTPSGGVGGNVRITSVTARGVGTQAVVLDGAVGGYINISGSVSASGYRSVTRSSNPAAALLYQAQEMEQGGAAVTIGGSVGGGLIVSAPPPVLSTTNLDLDGDGIPDTLQGSGAVASYGSAPAIQLGAVAAAAGGTASNIVLGPYSTGTLTTTSGDPVTGHFGMVIQGTVSANGLFDQLTSPNLPNAVSSTAIQIGGQILITPELFVITGTTRTIIPAVYAPSGTVTITGGLYNSGGILANSYQADATGIHVGTGGVVPTIYNDGNISAVSTQVNSATTVTPATGSTRAVPAPVAVNVTAIQIDPGGSVPSIVNNSGILAEITGTGGVGGAATAILDRSGTLSNLTNTGSITAELNQTLASAPMPGTTVAIDMSAGTGAQAITQNLSANSAASTPYLTTNTYVVGNVVSYNGLLYRAIAAVGNGNDPIDYPSFWREVGALSPSITGDIKFGSGPDTLDVEAGTVLAGTISMGGAANTLVVNGGAIVSGAVTETAGGKFSINVMNGTLSDTSPLAVNATSVNVGATGILLISADPAHGTNTKFTTSGASTFATGAQIGLTLQSVQYAQSETYVVLQTTGQGTLTTGTFGASTFNNAPFLYSAAPSVAAANGQVDLTVTRKSTAELGFNQAEGAALDAVLTAIPNNTAITSAVLAQTTQTGLKSVYDQLLPNQGIGVFETIDAAAQRISAMTGTTPDAGSRLAGTSLWLQEVNERVDRTDNSATLGSTAKLLGLVGGFEHMGPGGGAIGLTIAYMNTQEVDSAAALGTHVVASILEGGAYYRRAIGKFSFSARGAGGYAWFSGDRQFVAPGAFANALSNWGGFFVDSHAQVTYEVGFGRYYARPEISIDYTHLQESAYGEAGGGTGFDLNVGDRTSSRLSGQAIMVLGTQMGKADWLRPEIRFGYREVFSGQVGDTVASFAGGNPFTLVAPNDQGGWATVGFSIKGGTPYSYVALEGDADFRAGEQRFDLRVAGRSMF